MQFSMMRTKENKQQINYSREKSVNSILEISFDNGNKIVLYVSQQNQSNACNFIAATEKSPQSK